jgi:hypothetical protein
MTENVDAGALGSQHWLSEREVRLIELAASPESNDAIAALLDVTVDDLVRELERLLVKLQDRRLPGPVEPGSASGAA